MTDAPAFDGPRFDMSDREMFREDEGSPAAPLNFYPAKNMVASPVGLSPSSGGEGSSSLGGSPAGAGTSLYTDDGESRRYESPPVQEMPGTKAGYQAPPSPYGGGMQQQSLPPTMYTVPPTSVYDARYYSPATPSMPLYQESLALLGMGAGGYPTPTLPYGQPNYYNIYPPGYGMPGGYYSPEYHQAVPQPAYNTRQEAFPPQHQLTGDPYCLNCFGYPLQGNCIYCLAKVG